MSAPLTYEVVASWSAAQINKALDRNEAAERRWSNAFIAAGRGHELPSEYLQKTDPLSQQALQLFRDRNVLRYEVERRYGPGAPSRLPRGFKPLKGIYRGH